MQLIVRLHLERPIGYFIWEVYMPASFIVLMSFTSFWLDRSATPARVSLGVTTVLTMTTLLSSSDNNLPPTSYPKVFLIPNQISKINNSNKRFVIFTVYWNFPCWMFPIYFFGSNGIFSGQLLRKKKSHQEIAWIFKNF